MFVDIMRSLSNQDDLLKLIYPTKLQKQFIYHYFDEHVTSPVKDPPVFKIGLFDSNCTFIATF